MTPRDQQANTPPTPNIDPLLSEEARDYTRTEFDYVLADLNLEPAPQFERSNPWG